ncbi:multiple sugar transport system permease protein/putative aldouronate transport system permease protein [Lachnotalea glycerini]|jgi:putative aldouronate transport system permease protein|uniref:Carbohydrate ABC transporter permease n=1 Tax=Lachnotalea glycerini TaxID=1763509 RepID=A0A255IT17_9FIRM|nr:carbohydrate ABC transporter permease [Lachnotalea glycerini]PXV87761.1 multiple sugar transport system permease protein/putative aldouronate transport system permease protein [Lachnotalea glycerini]RDY32073.1 carbohydrate ABC transporter permease [Lachnotalea glycerini]
MTEIVLNKSKIKKGKDAVILDTIVVVVITLFCMFCILPFIMLIATSFETETNIVRDGYKLWPSTFTTQAYETVFKTGQIFKAYGVTVFITVVGTILSMAVTIMLSYPLSLSKVKYKTPISFFVYFTMLFNGGLVPSYLLISKYMNFRDNIWVLIIPVLLNPWNMFMLKNFFRSIPEELSEAAYIDGANDIKILTKVILPVSIPGIATISLFYALMYWNQWYNAMLYIDSKDLFPLQYYIMNLTRSMDAIKEMARMTGQSFSNLPSNSIRMATAVVTIGPVIFVYPFVQKYFTSGIMVGSIKG